MNGCALGFGRRIEIAVQSESLLGVLNSQKLTFPRTYSSTVSAAQQAVALVREEQIGFERGNVDERLKRTFPLALVSTL